MTDAPNRRLTTTGVGAAPVVGFVAAGAQLAALLLGHGGERVPATAPDPGIDGRWIVLTAGDWRSPPVLAAATFGERLVGLRAVPEGHGLLLHTRAVHGWGLRAPARVIQLDSEGAVGECRWLEPWRHIRWDRPAWTVELPAWQPWPPEGAKLLARRAPVTQL